MNLFKLGMLPFLIIILLCASCTKEEDLVGSAENFTQLYDIGGNMPEPLLKEEIQVLSEEDEVIGSTEFKCTTEQQSISAASGGTDGFPLFAPNNAVIYPGAMLQGNSIHTGNPDLIALKRGAGTISTDIIDGNSQSTVQVPLINRGNVIAAMNTIVGEGSQVVPANFGLKIVDIQSREQFALELGVNVNSTYVDLESNLSYSSSEEKSSFMVNLEQSYYTMTYDIPVSKESLFAPEVSLDDLSQYIYEGNPATYISDVTYGRIFYMLIESTSSQHDLKIAVESTFSKLKTEVEADIDINYFESLESVTYSIYAYGGESAGTIQAAGVANMEELVDILAETTDIKSAKPVSYVVRNVADNKIVATQLATTYEVENCVIASVNGTLPMLEHWTGGVIEAMGPVGAAYAEKNNSDQFILFNKDGDQYVRSTNGELSGPFSINELYENDVPFEIGAACVYKPSSISFISEKIIAFDLDGINYATATNGVWSNSKSIAQFGDGVHPFNLTGVGAIAHAPFESDAGFFDPNGLNNYHFNAEGNKYAHWYAKIGSATVDHFTGVHPLSDWGINDSVTNEISAVGAAIGFDQGNDHFTILFNKAGTKYIVYGNVNGDEPREVVGPFDL